MEELSGTFEIVLHRAVFWLCSLKLRYQQFMVAKPIQVQPRNVSLWLLPAGSERTTR
jgi:hypothetical protein